MSWQSRLRSPRARWAVPAVVALAVAGAFAVPALASAGADDLPDITPTELLAAVVEAEPQALTGTVVHTARLGLPELPVGDGGDIGPMALLGGSTTLRIWSDGADRSRVALLGTEAEFSMVRDGLKAWTYSSTDNEVVHYAPSPEDAAVLEELLADHGAAGPDAVADPDQFARAVLGMVEEHSIVSMDAATTVAGRDAYQLVVTPDDAETLVGRVVVAVDAATSMPLRLQVWSTQDSATPAMEVGYTDIAFGAPDPAVLEFSVPVGATVREVELPLSDLGTMAGLGGAEVPEGLEGLTDLDLSDLRDLRDLGPAELQERLGVDPAELERLAGLEGPERFAAMQELLAGMDLEGLGVEGLEDVDPQALAEAEAARAAETPGEGVRVLGSGWGTVLELSGEAKEMPDVGAEVPEGRLITSALVSILLTDDGRMLIGAVPGDTLRDLA